MKIISSVFLAFAVFLIVMVVSLHQAQAAPALCCGKSIDDHNACTTDVCGTRCQITHTPLAAINDFNTCTIDSCDKLTGKIKHTPKNVNDNNACTTDTCNALTGVVTHVPVNVDDNNACTNDSCDPITGIMHTPLPCGEASKTQISAIVMRNNQDLPESLTGCNEIDVMEIYINNPMGQGFGWTDIYDCGNDGEIDGISVCHQENWSGCSYEWLAPEQFVNFVPYLEVAKTFVGNRLSNLKSHPDNISYIDFKQWTPNCDNDLYEINFAYNGIAELSFLCRALNGKCELEMFDIKSAPYIRFLSIGSAGISNTVPQNYLQTVVEIINEMSNKIPDGFESMCTNEPLNFTFE